MNTTLASPDIKKMVAACLKNDRQAQIRLYELYVKQMYNTSLRIVHDSMLAEDVVQESFLKAFRSLNDFRNEVPFVAWLKRIVVNKSLDELRKLKHEMLRFDEQKMPDIPADNEGYEEREVEYNETLIQTIKQAMNELSDGYRVIFSLYFFEGYDHEEIAQILNIKPSTSRSQLTRAKFKVTEQLKKITIHYE